MRQRRLKNLDERLAKHEALICKVEEIPKTGWVNTFFKDPKTHHPLVSDKVVDEKEQSHSGRLFVELGCGKGRFITELALNNPDDYFVAIECQPSAAIRAMEKVAELGINNVKFFLKQIDDLGKYFATNELDGIYLNFSDPWPKARHEKRRLTHRNKLKVYGQLLKEGGFVAFKTDNTPLFDFSQEEFLYMEQPERLDEIGFKFQREDFSRDLHASVYMDKNVMTEYEEKFSILGEKIKYIKDIKLLHI